MDRSIDKAASHLAYTLKPEQRTIVSSFVQEDVFAVLPTGFGKSLCYECLPLVFDDMRTDRLKSIIIVVTPLIAIMKDQVWNHVLFLELTKSIMYYSHSI